MKTLRSLLFACILAFSVVHSSALNFAPTPTALVPRQSPAPGTSAVDSVATSASSTSASETSTTSETSTSQPPTTSDTSTTSSSTEVNETPTSTSSTTTESSNIPPSQTSQQPVQSTPVATTPPAVQTSVVEFTTTGEDGQASTVTITSTNTPTLTSSASASPSESKASDSGGGGLGVGSIVGMSVAGGVAVLGIVGFFVWKFTRKRFTDFDDHEAIKWPELNAHSAGAPDAIAPPTHDPVRGLDSESDLTRFDSTNYSTADFNSTDPYAVPPLPHMNPNQPYRDDPTVAAGYYDPYRGPVPGTIENGGSSVGHEWTGGEAIPMNQMNAGRMSPGPQAALRIMSPSPAPQAYGAEGMYEAGRQSPGPQAALGGGRASPGPQMAYGGRASPGPQMAYGGRASPGPHAAYDNYGAGAR
ncbi:hypothetical protein BDQ17DRAFT_1359451 [Cyathus striatus]|nr:hypothetical protein BDQ17DRAFT_1359451 [Cyathus striatus]